MHPKVARALRAARRPYADGGNVVRERATILPLGTYGDGTTRAAWPGVIYEPAAAAKRLVDYFMGGNYRPGDDDATRQLAEDSFTAASAVPVAGLAAAAVRPGVSLGSGGGKLGSNPLPIRAYHGTTHEIDGRMRPAPGARGTAVYFNTSPDAASSYATGDAGNYIRFAPTGDHPSVIPADIVGKVFDENAVVSPKERKAIAKARNDAVIADAASKGRKVYPDELMDPTEFAGPYFDRAYPPKGYNVLQALSYEGNEQNAMLKALGYSGRKGPAAGLSGGQDIAMFEPNSVRSALTGDVLYSNSSKASTPGLAALESNRVRGGMPTYKGYHGNQRGFRDVPPDEMWMVGERTPDAGRVASSYSGHHDLTEPARRHLSEIATDPDGTLGKSWNQADRPAVYAVEARLSNPMIVDARGEHWGAIPYGTTGRHGQYEKLMTSDELAKVARRLGHDGLVIDNVRDSVASGHSTPRTRVIAALKPETVFDDYGRQIFSNPSTASVLSLIQDRKDRE